MEDPKPGGILQANFTPSCDWGSCNNQESCERFDGEMWLPVCASCAVKPFEPEVSFGKFEPHGSGGNQDG